MPIRIKICGITCVDDAVAAAEAGADAIGLVFYEPSPRHVTLSKAIDIACSVGPYVTVTGLFVNPDEQYIDHVLNNVPVHVIQFHGDETMDYCERWRRPYVKALRMRPGLNVADTQASYSSAQGFLLDAYHPEKPGGTGATFDWARVPHSSPQSIVLAGGLTPDNVSNAIAQTQPYGVDVSGGVESAPGIKNHRKIAAFIKAARSGELT